ncbi:hypothetical protein PVAND_005816 [Polypedilum vanderplanki]|uniref:Uncharacterized protein n=1 Tax=Polypedilum vanderplanki TaxID=319348 RepID=A0A9J6C1N7_POLVA|nr:hypothetical protein PVAND_005816 [Polypedilum vanderplanki]
MASETIHIGGDQNMDYQMVAQIVEGLRKEQKTLAPFNARLNMHTEVRTLTFWRAIISECLASFIYVFIHVFVTRLISPLRTAMYIAAQLGGGIAGAALLYGYVFEKLLKISLWCSKS